MSQRVLSNRVLRVLNRATEINYESAKSEMLGLLEEEDRISDELTDAVQLLYFKAVQPAEERFSPIYAKLLNDIANSGRVKNEVRDCFRETIVEMCQASTKPRPSGDDAAAAAPPTRGNTKFLGHLYVVGAIDAPIVEKLLLDLMTRAEFALDDNDQAGADVSVQMLVDLLRVTATSLPPSAQDDLLPTLMTGISRLKGRPSTPVRLRFMLEDVIDLQQRGWVARVPGSAKWTGSRQENPA